MTVGAELNRGRAVPALLSYGFRPFFLFAALWAALAMALWLPMLSGHLALPSALAPIEWHVHELVYGYVPAVIAGFLLTAVPNWTGRRPIAGGMLLLLVLIWAAGRLAILTSGVIGAVVAAIVDLLFIPVLGIVVAREIVAGNNRRNLRVLALAALLMLGNLLFHLESIAGLGRGYGIRLGIAAIILLISLIGGRIIPSFTHNWLARRGASRLPSPFDRFDAIVMAITALTLLSWVVLPEATTTAALALLAGLLNAARLVRWAGAGTAAEPLVLILHVAFAFVPVGFLLLALGIVAPAVVTATGAVHGWTAGAIGLMTLAVMTRASLGHTGQPLTATVPVQLIYLAAIIAALARIVAAFGVLREPMLHLSATAWILAFAGFAAVYAPLLLRARPRG
ncbi:MAG: NnrS family protein [Hyphomicrobiales bacterium]|nr:NnrS family protein [Hyphomicrobiales bacterium]